ncbi:hypothetical protein NHQ30_006350 [Ciborinia camelliae]|nr:hypothetical protein NHQ30_006350 [Ciborinia camelliae]
MRNRNHSTVLAVNDALTAFACLSIVDRFGIGIVGFEVGGGAAGMANVIQDASEKYDENDGEDGDESDGDAGD